MRKVIFWALMLIMLSMIGLRFYDKELFFSLIPVRSLKSENKKKEEIRKLEEKASEYEKLLKKKVAVADKLGKVYEDLGKKYLEHKNWQLAREAFEKALAHGYNNPTVNYSLGVIYANMGKNIENIEYYDKSILYYEKALEMKEKYIEARYGLGLVLYYGKKEKQKGQKEIEKVVLEFPSFYPARFALGRIYFENKQYEKSLDVYQSLYADFENKTDSKKYKKEKENLRENIQAVMAQIKRKGH